MPINNAAKVATLVVYGTHLTIHTALDTAVSALAVQTQIHSVNIVRKAVGNNFMAVVLYELQ
tara:strand:+ start:176 stop:361 length:186 start_codon:yes stop_codon:yes gene_type:complete